MKKSFKITSLIAAAVIVFSACSDAGQSASVPEEGSGAEKSDSVSLLDLRVSVDHPGVPGYDVGYDFLAYYGEEFSQTKLLPTEYSLYCDYPEIKIDGSSVTVPADFAEKHPDVDYINIYAKYGQDETQTDYYTLPVKRWEQTFADEFDTYDKNVWSFDGYNPSSVIGKDETTGRELLSGKDPDLPYIRDGNLVLSIKKGKKTLYDQGKPWVSDYQSCTITTENSFTQQYGCFMIYCKLPPKNDTAGCISAFWLMPAEGNWGQSFFFKKTGSDILSDYNCGEIDIFEYSPAWSGEPQLQITEHWWNDSLEKLESGPSTELRVENEKLGNEYVNVACVWTPNGLFTYVDGVLSKSRVGLQPTDQEAYILISQGSGSLPSAESQAWSGTFTDDNLEAKTEYLIDWVRVYK